MLELLFGHGVLSALLCSDAGAIVWAFECGAECIAVL